MTQALINPDILRWARERSQLTVDRLAKSLSTKPERIGEWEAGSKTPTFRQAQDIASKLHIPFGYLFLSKPPELKPPIPDLRKVSENRIGHFSPDFYDLLNDILRKQEWYRDYLQEEGEEGRPFVGRFSMSDPPSEIAENIRSELRIDRELRKGARSWSEYFSLLIANAEKAGILVLRSGIVGTNTNRTLSRDEFLGFAITDDYAPLIFINGKDWEVRKIFTLVHELAHLWIGQSGVSNLDLRSVVKGQVSRVERICDQIAAEVLVPLSEFANHWRPGDSIEKNVARLSSHYRVSPIVILRRALDFGRIGKAEFFHEYERQRKKSKPPKPGGRGNFYATLKTRNGSRFTYAVLSAAAEGRLLYRDAGRLLGVKKTKTLLSAASRLGIQ